jgi:hypothetical protein
MTIEECRTLVRESKEEVYDKLGGDNDDQLQPLYMYLDKIDGQLRLEIIDPHVVEIEATSKNLRSVLEPIKEDIESLEKFADLLDKVDKVTKNVVNVANAAFQASKLI